MKIKVLPSCPDAGRLFKKSGRSGAATRIACPWKG
jgi:hypothetical protein